MDLNKYNQRLLATLGTLAVIGLVLILAAGIFEFLRYELRRNRPHRANDGIVIDRNSAVDTNSFSFSHAISILEPYQLDSSRPVFIVPIGQKDQKSKRVEILTAGLNFSSYELSEDYYYSRFSGLYNNFVLIDYVRDIRVPIFNKKIALTEWAYIKIGSKQLILFKGTGTDSDGNGRLNDDDFQSLFVFDVATQETKELSFENQTVREFQPLSKTSKIYVRTGRDLNNDKVFDSSKEPTDLYFYDVATGESETLVPEDVKQEIHKILNK